MSMGMGYLNYPQAGRQLKVPLHTRRCQGHIPLTESSSLNSQICRSRTFAISTQTHNILKQRQSIFRATTRQIKMPLREGPPLYPYRASKSQKHRIACLG